MVVSVYGVRVNPLPDPLDMPPALYLGMGLNALTYLRLQSTNAPVYLRMSGVGPMMLTSLEGGLTRVQYDGYHTDVLESPEDIIAGLGGTLSVLAP